VKNVQVIDGAENCGYSVYSVSDQHFDILFPDTGQDIEFSEDLFERVGHDVANKILSSMWNARVEKPALEGIHGTIFFGLSERKTYYPTKRESDLDGPVRL